MKRITTLLLVLLIVALFLNGCTSTTPDIGGDQETPEGTQDAQDSDSETAADEILQPPAFPEGA